MKKKNILMIAPTPFFADRGGHMRIYEEAKSLTEKGHYVHIVTYHIGRDVEDLQITRIPNIIPYRKLSAGPSFTKIILDLLLILTTIKILTTKKFDVLHAHLHEGVIVGYLPSKLFRIPLLFDAQGSLVAEVLSHEFTNNAILINIFFIIEKLTIKLADFIIVSSHHTRQFIKKMGDRDQIQTVLDGANLSNFHPEVQPITTKWKTDELPVIGYLGGLDPHKGIDYFIDSIPYLKSSANILIMGYPGIDRVRNRVKELNTENEIKVLGRIPYDQAPNYLAALDIAVAPKIFDSGEVNGKLLNYMAMRLPIVCFEHQSNRTFLGEDGVYAKYKDEKDFAIKLDNLINKPDLRNIKGTKLYNRVVTEYSWHANASKLEEIYLKLNTW